MSFSVAYVEFDHVHCPLLPLRILIPFLKLNSPVHLFHITLLDILTTLGDRVSYFLMAVEDTVERVSLRFLFVF